MMIGNQILFLTLFLKKSNKAILLVEGFLPARSIHVMRNWQDPSKSPWFIIDEDSDIQTFSMFQFHQKDLKCFLPQK